MAGDIDMSCKAFGLLCGLVTLVLVLVGLPALLVRLEASAENCPCSDNNDLFSASVSSDTIVSALVTGPAGQRSYEAVVLSTFKVWATRETKDSVVIFLLLARG